MNIPATIVGNAGRDPELRFSKQGKAIVTLPVAVGSRRRDESGQWVDGDTSWFRVTAFEPAAQAVADQVKKGSTVIVTGRLKVSEWTGQDGSKRTTAEILADDVGLSLARAGRAAGHAATAAPHSTAPQASADPWTPANDTPPF